LANSDRSGAGSQKVFLVVVVLVLVGQVAHVVRADGRDERLGDGDTFEALLEGGNLLVDRLRSLVGHGPDAEGAHSQRFLGLGGGLILTALAGCG
jgi:hypothetical protein